MPNHFGWIDGGIMVVYLLALGGVGFYFSRRQSNLDEYFRAGQSMSWLPVGLSLMAALNSGIDYMTQPSASIQHGLVYLPSLVTWLLAYFYVAYLILPFYRRLDLFSVYQYLERRFDVRVRTLAAIVFVLWRLSWMATVLYVPCLALHAASGKTIPLIPMIVAVGVMVTLYTTLGGIKGVIWTNVIQFCVMFTGLAITIAVILWNVPGGIGQVWSIADQHDKTSFGIAIPSMAAAQGFGGKTAAFFSERLTAVGILLAILVSRLTAFTGDQIAVQRFQTARSIRDERPAFIVNALGDFTWMCGLSFVGLALFAYFTRVGWPEAVAPDDILPYFMGTVFPTGVTGLVIAAIFAASLSSAESAINSSSSVLLIDVYNRLYLKRETSEGSFAPGEQRSQIRASRIIGLIIGGIGTLLGVTVAVQVGDLIKLGAAVVGLFTGPLLGIYLLGIFTQRARSMGVLIGAVIGSAVALYVAFVANSDPPEALRQYSIFPFGPVWPSIFGLIVTLVVGYVSSLLIGGTDARGAALTFRGVMASKRKEEELVSLG